MKDSILFLIRCPRCHKTFPLLSPRYDWHRLTCWMRNKKRDTIKDKSLRKIVDLSHNLDRACKDDIYRHKLMINHKVKSK